ncbi:hypothetical protein KHM83_04345 [Fusibacter paucivorans]|uniref:Uncharacterized protein n=1 Tax=Fusibacter paucivorans TaxID=76009 RepID=A0ABS5PNI0_9FIRM|nr:hypothetical protein [Fusibacter paucivorans]MBS7525906.1 hypothetical protein [Fusibacter paucivorans]
MSAIKRKASKSAAKLLTHAKRFAPAVGHLLSTLDVVETTGKIVKPIVDDGYSKQRERLKRIFVKQEKQFESYVICHEKTGIKESGSTEAEALMHFVERLEVLRKNRVLSASGKRRRAELRLIEKLNSIVSDGETIEQHLYRIEVDRRLLPAVKRKQSRRQLK